MYDKVERIGTGTQFQHGKFNNRIYLMKLKDEDIHDIFPVFKELIEKYNYSKIFAKLPDWAVPVFQAEGFFIEAMIPNFFNGSSSCFFMVKYYDNERLKIDNSESLYQLSILLKKNSKTKRIIDENKNKYVIKKLNASNISQLTELYKMVFKTYPFPIYDPNYIKEVMQDGETQFYGCFHNNNLIAASSAEIDSESLNAEMTDFATNPDFRGNRLSIKLLKTMEEDLKIQGIKTVYTIARLNSIAMNKTFISKNYIFGGTLINNTNIAGKIESMNIWYKKLI